MFGFIVRTVRNTIILESELVRTGFESAVEQYNALRRDVLYNHQHFHKVLNPVSLFLFIVLQSQSSDPTVEGALRLVGTDIKIVLDGVVVTLPFQ